MEWLLLILLMVCQCAPMLDQVRPKTIVNVAITELNVNMKDLLKQ
jgi:hypothetical protein